MIHLEAEKIGCDLSCIDHVHGEVWQLGNGMRSKVGVMNVYEAVIYISNDFEILVKTMRFIVMYPHQRWGLEVTRSKRLSQVFSYRSRNNPRLWSNFTSSAS